MKTNKKRKTPSARAPRKKKAPPPPVASRGRTVVLPLVVLVLVVAIGAVGWMWKSELRTRGVTVTGAVHTPADTVRALARIDSAALFFAIDTAAIAARISQVAWVDTAYVRRMPDVTVAIDVVERTPALLAVDADGRPERYLDANGYQMPVVRGAAYDVPLLRGLDEPYIPGRPVARDEVHALLDVLDGLDPSTDALLSAFALTDDGLQLYTAPKPGRGAIEVALGEGGYRDKLSRLHAFWEQAVLAQREKQFDWIDLRFDSQIITRERTLTQ